MKLIIDISEDDYKKVLDGRASVSMMRKAIGNGTPLKQEPTATLDKIRAEIKDFVYPDDCSDYLLGFNFGLMRAAQVINKYRAEGSEKDEL